MPNPLLFEDPSDPENSVVFTVNQAGGVGVSVAEESAVGSYNRTFTCTFYLSPEQAIELAEFLAAYGFTAPRSTADSGLDI
jgi:hypothetical protein